MADGIGLLFPGQGSQHVGMGKALSEAFPEARRTFEEADEALGFSLSTLCWEGPEDELTRTKNAQPALLTHSVAVWRLLSGRRLPVRIAAGHSLGEFSAYVAAGTLEFADAVRAVRRRGELMFASGEARPGSMAAVLGLDDAAVEEACRAASRPGSVVVPANFNAPGQIVVSGDRDAVARAGDRLKEAGAKRVLPLNVSGAFHSPLMEVAEAGLREHLEGIVFRSPAFPVVSNAAARPVSEADEARRLIVAQLTSPVRWVASVRAMIDTGVRRYLELGPGNVLTGLLKRIEKESEGKALGTPEELERFTSEEIASWS
jgi:[acyl-carrier-protein] S-malonyltransferase